MDSTTLTFTVLGEPIGKGSTVSRVATYGNGQIVYKHGRPVVISHDSKGREGYRAEEAVAAEALVAREAAGWELLRGIAVEVWTRFYTQRPKGHYGTGRNAGLLKDSAPARPITKPDKDKLERRVLDALSGVIYADDSQVVGGEPSKWYAEGDDPARIEIEVRVLEQQTVGVQVDVDQLALVA
jgi:Holliday junction resolvase RusA-like endonuclease